MSDIDEKDTGERDIVRQALELPRELEAPREMWAGIEARIEIKERRARLVRRGIAGASMLLAAAAVILAVRAVKPPRVDDRTAAPTLRLAGSLRSPRSTCAPATAIRIRSGWSARS